MRSLSVRYEIDSTFCGNGALRRFAGKGRPLHFPSYDADESAFWWLRRTGGEPPVHHQIEKPGLAILAEAAESELGDFLSQRASHIS
jgi:hypothetical protein